MKKSSKKMSSKRRRALARGPRFSGPQMQGAPAGVSQDLQQFTRFLPGKGGEGIRMHTCFAMATLLRATGGGAGSALQMASATVGVSLQLNATSPAVLSDSGTKSEQDYLSPVFDLIGSAFVRYRVEKLVFHYEPQCSATTTERMVFAFAVDPMHPVLWNASVPTQSGLLSLADSVAFAPWRAWSLDVSQRLEKERLYTFSDASTSVGAFTERFSDFGVISCITSASLTSSAPSGVLYAEIVVGFDEFCPISLSRPDMASALLPKLARHLETHVKPGPPKEERPQESASETPKSLYWQNLSEKRV